MRGKRLKGGLKDDNLRYWKSLRKYEQSQRDMFRKNRAERSKSAKTQRFDERRKRFERSVAVETKQNHGK